MDSAYRLPLAVYAARLPTVGGGLPADSEMAFCGCLRSYGPRPAHAFAPCGGQSIRAQGSHLDSRTLRSTPESGARAGYDGAKRKNGSKVHAAVDTLGHLLALLVNPADEQDREQIGELAKAIQ